LSHEEEAKQQIRSSKSPGDPASGSFVGKIVHCHSGVTTTLNHFCVILREMPKTVLLAELSTGWKNDNPDRGYERPLLQDGRSGRESLEELFASANPAWRDPRNDPLARLRMDRKYFDPHEGHEALWLKHIHNREVGYDAVIVRVFRANKVIAKNGLTVFCHGHLSFGIWDGQDKRYDHSD